MPRTLANTLLIFTLLVFAVLSWQWLDEDTVAGVDEQNTIQMAKNETDYYLQGFRITNVNNTKGQVYELSGNTLSHYFESGRSLIEEPSVQIYSNDNDYWTGRARAGNLSADFSVLELTGSVDLAHHRNSDTPEIMIGAESITIDTMKRQIASAQPVKITAAKWTVTANRMRTDVDNGMLSFDSGVEAHYVVED